MPSPPAMRRRSSSRRLLALSAACLVAACSPRSNAPSSADPARASAPPVDEPDAGPPLPTLTLDEVEARLGQPGVFVYDANPREMYDAKHVPGARWIPWNHVTAEALPPDRNATLIFYCANEACSASPTAAASAARLGYARVFVMSRGILGWKKAGKPIETSAR